MSTIVVVKRSHDFMAFIEGNRAKWGCGRNAWEAIGSLIMVWGEDFQIEVKMPSVEAQS